MDIYVLERRDGINYDEATGFVVIAPDIDGARKMASELAGDERAATWLAPALTSCIRIGEASPGLDARVVLGSFRAS